jgi:hypothetical protein
MMLQGPPNEDSDQPPGFPGGDNPWLPPAGDAAKRIIEFVKWWGDGRIDRADHDAPPLFARDLEAVAKAVLR